MLPWLTLKRNHYLDKYAQAWADEYAACHTCAPADVAPQNPASHEYELFTVSGSSSSSRVHKAMDYIADHFPGLWDSAADNFGAIGWHEKGSTAYVALVVADYTSLPFDKIGTVSIPSTPRVGKTVTPVVSGFSPHPDSYTVSFSLEPTLFFVASNYTPVAADLAHSLSVRIVAHKAGYGDYTITATSKHPIGLGTIVAPKSEVVVGHRNVDSGIGTVTTGWSFPSSVSWSYVWYRNGVVIPGATTSGYVLAAADLNKRVDVKVSATAPGYHSATASTHTSKRVGLPLLVVTTPLRITGEVIVGDLLTAQPAVFSTAPSSVSFQWSENGHTIHGATHSTYRIPGSYVGRSLDVTEVAHASGHAATTVPTSSTDAVAPGTIQIVSAPSLTGTEAVGHRVTSGPGEYDPASVTVKYQWYSGANKIAGATKSYRIIKASDLVGELLLRITVTREGYGTLQSFYSE